MKWILATILTDGVFIVARAGFALTTLALLVHALNHYTRAQLTFMITKAKSEKCSYHHAHYPTNISTVLFIENYLK